MARTAAQELTDRVRLFDSNVDVILHEGGEWQLRKVRGVGEDGLSIRQPQVLSATMTYGDMVRLINTRYGASLDACRKGE